MPQEFQRKMDAKLIAAIVATGLLSFTGVVIETAMNVTFPTLMRELDVNLATVQWVTTGYLLALAIVVPASAFFKKRFHARTLFAAANLLFIGGTVLGYLAPSFAVLLTGRILQGIGTGVALPLMFNIVMEQAPKDRIGMVMGCATLVVAMAPAVGPSVGGLIVNDYGWRMIFLALLPILAFSLIIGLPSIRQVTVLTRAALPLRSYLLLAASFTAFILAASLAGDLGWTDPLVLILFAASALFLYAFCRSSMHDTEPFIHLSVFRRGAFRLSVLGLVLLQFICLGIGFFIPNFAQIVLSENPFVAGCILLRHSVGGCSTDSAHGARSSPAVFSSYLQHSASLCSSLRRMRRCSRASISLLRSDRHLSRAIRWSADLALCRRSCVPTAMRCSTRCSSLRARLALPSSRPSSPCRRHIWRISPPQHVRAAGTRASSSSPSRSYSSSVWSGQQKFPKIIF